MTDEPKQLSEEEEYELFLSQQDAEEGAKPEDQPEPEAERAAPDKEPEPEPFEGFSQLPEQAREYMDRLQRERGEWEQKWRAQHGQLAPTQRQASELAREKERLQRDLEAQKALIAAEAAKNGAFAQKLAKYKSDFPEEAEVLEGVVGPLKQQIEQSNKALQELQSKLGEQRQELYVTQQLSTLSQAHPDWQAAYHSEDFAEWKKHAPAAVLEKLGSMEAGPNIEALSLFKADLEAARKLYEQSRGQTQQRRPSRHDVAPTSRGRQSGLARPNDTMTEEEEAYAAWLATQE